MNDLKLNISKQIAAPIEKVFAAWLDPAMLAQFMLPMPGMVNPKCSNEPTKSGSFEILMLVGNDWVAHTGKYLELEAPNKLVFTWASPASPEDSVVTLNFTAISDTQTKIDLQQVKFLDQERRDNHQGGWSNILEALDKLVA